MKRTGTWRHFHFVDIDECNSSPCENGGTCVDGVYEYTCSCTFGHTGDQCETSKNFLVDKCFTFIEYLFFFLDIDECASFPCTNGGTCIDEIDNFTCQCMSGFTGDQCETSGYL